MDPSLLEVKVEPVDSAIAACALCLSTSEEVFLSLSDLSEFYDFFKPCGVGLNSLGETSYVYACQYCSKRAEQCLDFIKNVKSAELMFLNFLRNKPEVNADILDTFKEKGLRKPVNLSTCVISGFDYSYYELACSDNSQLAIKLVPTDLGKQILIMKNNLVTLDDNQSQPVKLVHSNPSNSGANIKDENVEYCQIFSQDQEEESEPWTDITYSVEIGSQDEVQEEYAEAEDYEEQNHIRKTRTSVKTSLPQQFIHLSLSIEEQLAELEQRRESDEFVNRPFKCYKCAAGFVDKISLERHNEMHSSERGPFVCQICTRRFPNKRGLHHHEKLHQDRWRCSKCDKFLTSRHHCSVHYSECISSDPVQCLICLSYFKSQVGLSNHMSKRHNKNRFYICNECGKSFTLKESLVYHMKTHTERELLTCNVCEKKYSNRYSLISHMELHTRKENDPSCYCKDCDKYFKSKHLLQLHLKNSLYHVKREDFRHKCAHCNMRYAQFHSLVKHVKLVHSGPNCYMCNICNKAFHTTRALMKHNQREHSEKKRDKLCNVCGKTFTSERVLIPHMRKHTKERPYTCVVCNSTFIYLSSMHTHMKQIHKLTTQEIKQVIAKANECKQEIEYLEEDEMELLEVLKEEQERDNNVGKVRVKIIDAKTLEQPKVRIVDLDRKRVIKPKVPIDV